MRRRSPLASAAVHRKKQDRIPRCLSRDVFGPLRRKTPRQGGFYLPGLAWREHHLQGDIPITCFLRRRRARSDGAGRRVDSNNLQGAVEAARRSPTNAVDATLVTFHAIGHRIHAVAVEATPGTIDTLD